MTMFNYKYVDEILLHYCGTDIDFCNVLKCLNKYYYGITNTNNIYKSWKSFLHHHKKNNMDTMNFKNALFKNACKKGNMIFFNGVV